MSENDNSTSEREKITELSKEGYLLLKQDRLEEAEGRFKVILGLEKTNAYALAGLGDIARQNGDYKKALEYYLECLDSHPDNNYALFGVADCYRGLHEYGNAIETWLNCLSHDDHNLSIIANIADAYRKIMDIKKAEEYYLKALELNSRYEHALKGLGYLYFDAKMYTEAINYWTEVFKRHKELAEDVKILTMVGNCYRKSLRFKEALPYFARAHEIEPHNFFSLFGIADCYRGLNLYKEAKEYYKKILELEPENQSIITRQGDMCVKLGEIDEAGQYYDKCLEIGDDIYAYLGFVHIQKAKGDYGEALRLLEAMSTLYPDNQRIQREMQECRQKNG